MSVETLIEKGEFLNSVQFSPDGKSILVSASPEAFNGIGKNVEEGQTPSMIDTQLYPKSGKFTLLKTPEEYIKSFSLASSAAEMAFSGQSASNADRLYKMNTKTLKSQLVDDLSARELKDVELGECKAWNFVNSRGDTLCCRYYLPPHFDAAKKYPMIVNYYGGCSPTSRMFQSRYPHHVYAAMGYVVLVAG